MPSNGSQLRTRTLPLDFPLSFQLAVLNNVVYFQSEATRIDALSDSNGSSLWHYTSQVPFISFPTIADGVGYVGTLDSHLTALRNNDGILLWTYRSSNPFQSFSPIMANGMIYLSLQKGGMDVLRANTGVLLSCYIRPIPSLGLYPQPLVANRVVDTLTQDGHLSALHATNGSTIWRVALHATDILPPTIIAGGVIDVETLEGSLDAIAESSGSVLWSYQGRGRRAGIAHSWSRSDLIGLPATSGFNT